MASDLNKPNGQAVITPKNGPGFVEALPVKKFHGVGPATAERMRKVRHRNRARSESQVTAVSAGAFRQVRPYFYGIARGIDERSVKPDRIRKSVGAEDTFVEDIDDLEHATLELKTAGRKGLEILRGAGHQRQDGDRQDQVFGFHPGDQKPDDYLSVGERRGNYRNRIRAAGVRPSFQALCTATRGYVVIADQ
jgi:hypothetical protein